MAEKRIKRVLGKESKIACAVLAAVIIVVTPLVVISDINRMYNDVMTVFQEGAEKDGLSIQVDLAVRSASAYNLAAVAKRYMGGDNETIQSAELAAKALDEADGPAAKYAANEDLEKAFNRLYEVLGEMELSEKDEQYRQSLYAEMKSRNRTMGNDPYNQMAEEYNQKLEQFPANLLGAVFQLKKAELFQ